MNHIYRSIWNESLGTWIAVSENTKAKGKAVSKGNQLLATGLLLCSSTCWALPTGGQVVAGQVNINTPSATQMHITQGTQQAIVNWNGFSIAPAETVNIQQPNAQAALLNRVVGIDASVIQGQFNANGQVYLVNPNGVLFSNTAQVDVGGLIASANNISNADFLSGVYHFTQEGATGVVSNQGTIKVPVGGSVALIGTQVSNSGTIATPQGSTILAAGATVDLDFKGAGLVEVKVPQAALNSQVSNSGAILADGGRVVLTAQATNQLVATVINQSGLIQAKSLTSRNGEIILAGGSNGTTQISGTMDVSGQQNGGTITVTGQNINLASSSNLIAESLNSGIAGTVQVLGDMKNGSVNVAGNLNASAFGTANGGFIETSAAHVNIADTAKITTAAANGNTGTWLIDPNDFTIAASGGNITGATLSSELNLNNVDISTFRMGTPGGNGDIFVNDAISWSSGNSLILNAERNIYINADILASGAIGASPTLVLRYGQAFQYGSPDSHYIIDPAVTIKLPFGDNFATQSGYLGSMDYHLNYEHIPDDSNTVSGILNSSDVSPENESSHQPSALSDESQNLAEFADSMDDSSYLNSSMAEDFSMPEDDHGSVPLFYATNTNQVFEPKFSIKNSAGKIHDLKLSANKQFLSLLLEDGSVRIWDFQLGVQRQVDIENSKNVLTSLGRTDTSGALQTIVSQSGIDVYDILSSSLDKNLKESDIAHLANSNDGTLLLINTGVNNLQLWDGKQNQKRWQTHYERGEVKNLLISDNKHYGAIVGRQPGSYMLSDKLQPLTDAVDLLNLETGKIIKSLPNLGDDIVYMQFKNDDTLQVGLANGEMKDWHLANNRLETVAGLTEPIIAVDTVGENTAYLLKNGKAQVINPQGKVQMNIENKGNPFKKVLLLEEGKKLLTAMTSGDLSLWDVATGKKMLNLFSTQQGGWTVMDGFGRFDGSEKALENFSWIADEEDIPLNNFSENYYEPGLLANVLKNQDYLNSNPNVVKAGITLPPKVSLQLADQHNDDKVALQMDVFDRGGGINKLNVYHNGRLLSDKNIALANKNPDEEGVEHQSFLINVTPTSGKNTLNVSASNAMGIENSSAELSFDGKSKAYSSSLRLLSVGINEYSDNRMNLQYSVPDANLIRQVLKNNAKLTFNKALFNQNATKAKILAELKELSLGSEQDVMVIYFAGHGLAVGKEWYFLPYETQLTTEENIASKSVTATELSNIFKNSKVQHILLMVDACYSGAGMGAFSQLQNTQRHFSRQLSHSLGITVITAASKDQQAAETQSLGHGVFTYLMSQELQKKHSGEPITAHNIVNKITKTLPSFSKKEVGVSQEPVAYTHGSDFILTGSDSAKGADKNSAATHAAPDLPKK